MRIAFARQHRGDRAAAHDGDAVAHAEDFRQVARNHQHGQTFLREAADDFVDFALRADVHALRRLVEDEQLRLRREPAGEGDFLLVAAAERLPPGASGPGGLASSRSRMKSSAQRALRAEAQPRCREKSGGESPSSCCARSAFRESRRGGGDLPARRRCRARSASCGERDVDALAVQA